MLKESQMTNKNEEKEEPGKKVDQKIEVFEKTINTFHKCLEDEDRFISNLEEKFTEIERKYDMI